MFILENYIHKNCIKQRTGYILVLLYKQNYAKGKLYYLLILENH